jgi:hypothetical protein
MRIDLEKRDPLENSELIMDMARDRDDNEVYPGGASVDYRLDKIYEGAGTPEALALIVSLTSQAASSMGINLFSNWLWEKLTKHKVRKIQIEGLDIHLNNKGEFQRILAKKLIIEG